MTTHFIMRSDLLGRSVINQQTTEEVGRLTKLFIDLRMVGQKSGL